MYVARHSTFLEKEFLARKASGRILQLEEVRDKPLWEDLAAEPFREPVVEVVCRRYVTADAMGMAKVRGRREEEDVDGARIGLSTNTVRIPRCTQVGALRRDNTPTPACLFSINALELQ